MSFFKSVAHILYVKMSCTTKKITHSILCEDEKCTERNFICQYDSLISLLLLHFFWGGGGIKSK